MERLLQPDTGLMIWTIVSFLTLVFILGKFAWKPLIQALKEREEGIRKAIQESQLAREAAESLKASHEQKLARAQEEVQALLAQAQADSQSAREKMIREAQEESRRLLEKAKQEIEEESRKALAGLKSEVAKLSVMEAEKLLRRSIDRRTQDEFLKDALKDLEKHSKELN